MKKSWADHCSSDEDSEPAKHQLPENSIPSNQGAFPYNDTIDTDLSFTDRSGTFLTKDVTLGEEYPPAPPPVDFGHIPPNAPGRAPFTAHIGNLSFGVKEGPELADEVEKLVRDRYLGDESVTVTEARVGVDRETGKRKGFGYVEFDSLKELLILLNLNDGFSEIAGRMVRIDIAQSTRRRRTSRNDSYHRGSDDIPNDIDGSQFRGGVRRQPTDGVKPRRRSLKLNPKTENSDTRFEGSSDIFGGAKPKEYNAIEQKDTIHSNQKGGRGDRRGGKGRGNGHRGHGRGGGDRKKHSGGRVGGGRKRGNGRKHTASGVDGWDEAPGSSGKNQLSSPTAGLNQNEKKNITKVQNSFALLCDSDSN